MYSEQEPKRQQNLRPCVLVKKWAFEKYSKSRHSRTIKSVQDLICTLLGSGSEWQKTSVTSDGNFSSYLIGRS